MTLLCVHPHPDDESISCGGVLARYAAEGRGVAVVTCTGGEEGENLAGIDLGGESLTVHRRRELAAALAALGVTEHRWLGYRDSGMVDTRANDHPDSFHRADLDTAAGRLAMIVRELRPEVIVSDDERGSYGHPDHVKAHHVTTRARELAADPGWSPATSAWRVPRRYAHTLSRSRVAAVHEQLLEAGLPSPFGEDGVGVDELALGTADELVTTRIDVSDRLEVKRAALAAHRSQIAADSFFLNLPPELSREVFGVEEFVLLEGDPPADGEPL